MAVTNVTPTISYTADGSAGAVYPIPFKLLQDSDLKMYIDGTLSADGFTVGGTKPDAATVTTTVDYANGVKVTFNREVECEQQTDFTEGESVPGQRIEDGLDNLAMQIQQNKEAVDRALKTGPGQTAPGGTVTQAADTLLGQDSSGDLINRTANEAVTFLGITSSVDAAAASASAASASASNAEGFSILANTSATTAENARISAESDAAEVSAALDSVQPAINATNAFTIDNPNATGIVGVTIGGTGHNGDGGSPYDPDTAGASIAQEITANSPYVTAVYLGSDRVQVTAKAEGTLGNGITCVDAGFGTTTWDSASTSGGEDGKILVTGPQVFTATEQAQIRANIGSGLEINVIEDFNAVGDGVADDTDAIQAAFAEARSTGKKLVSPPGKSYRVSSVLAIDWRYFHIDFSGSKIIGTTASQNVIEVGLVGGQTQMGRIERLFIEGLGYDQGQSLLYFLDNSPKIVEVELCEFEKGEHGVYTQHTDYFGIRRCKWRFNKYSYRAGTTSNVTYMESCSIGEGNAGAGEETDRHIWLEDADSFTAVGSECGDGDVGIYIDNQSVGVNKNVRFIGHRNERCRVHDVYSPGSPVNVPVFVNFQNCDFQDKSSNTAKTYFVEVDNITWLTMKECVFVKQGAGATVTDAVKTNSASAKIHLEKNQVTAGVNHFKAYNNVTNNYEKVVTGADGTMDVAAPFILNGKIEGTLSATSTKLICTLPRDIKVREVFFSSESTSTDSGPDYWDFSIERYNNGSSIGTVATSNTLSSRLGTPLRWNLATNGASLVLTRTESLVLVATKNGSADNITGLSFDISYEPLN